MNAVPRAAVEVDPARRKAGLLLVTTGILHACLFLLAYGLLSSTPRAQATNAELVAFYESESRRRMVLVGLYVMPFAGIAFLWFSTILRVMTRASAQHELLAGVQLVSGILYVGLFFVGAAASSVLAVSLEASHASLDPVLARQFPLFSGTLLLAFAMRMAAMFVFTTSRLGRLSGVLPSWFANLGVLVGLFLLFSSSFSRMLVLVFPVWLLALCALLFLRVWLSSGPASAPAEPGNTP